jgi:prevent-host-death family protein
MASKKRVPAAEARAAMKDLVDAVKDRNERIKITRYGKTVAYLVPAKDGEHLESCGDELEACSNRLQSERNGTPPPLGTKNVRPEGGRAARRPRPGSRRPAGGPRAR